MAKAVLTKAKTVSYNQNSAFFLENIYHESIWNNDIMTIFLCVCYKKQVNLKPSLALEKKECRIR